MLEFAFAKLTVIWLNLQLCLFHYYHYLKLANVCSHTQKIQCHTRKNPSFIHAIWLVQSAGKQRQKTTLSSCSSSHSSNVSLYLIHVKMLYTKQ